MGEPLTVVPPCSLCGGSLRFGAVSNPEGRLICWDCTGRDRPKKHETSSSPPSFVPRAALEDALEGLLDVISYVDPYFRQKWHHDDYVERAREALK